MANKSGVQPPAGAGSHRSGGSGGATDGLGVFKDGVSALAGRGGGHTIPRYPNVDGVRLGGGDDNKSAPPHGEVEMSQGANTDANRAHSQHGRAHAQQVTNRDGSTHPMQHAKQSGNGRW
jgi:hypothetical protein